jgi:opacity protein-like surface antigen
MKKFLTLLLVLAMICCLLPAAYAADNTAETAAATLYSLGLFSGTGTNSDGTPKFDLNRTLNRAEAVTMLVNLLGKSDAAASGSWTSPFKDVPDWAKAAVGYAYESGLVGGLNADTFGSRQPVTANQFAALVLRALGYKDGQDFSFADAAKFAEKLGLTETDLTAVKTFLRGDAVKIAAAALSVDYKDSGAVLSQVIAMSKELAAQSGKDVSPPYDLPCRRRRDGGSSCRPSHSPGTRADGIAELVHHRHAGVGPVGGQYGAGGRQRVDVLRKQQAGRATCRWRTR